ncbi:MAG: hypothetical protein K0S47_648 [Herbinix sp.]|jgi:hypothetical protein|nr:hypothetical protein [Herbinix sp.]
MAQQKNEPKKSIIINRRPILSLLIGLGFISVIMLSMMLGASGEHSKSQGLPKKTERGDDIQAFSYHSYDSEMLAVVKDVDIDAMEVSLLDTETKEIRLLSYTGGSNVTDKYGKVITVNQIPIGTIVSVGYQNENNKLITMSISKDAWEYVGVTNLSINRTDKVMKVASNKYKYNDDIVIIDGDTLIPVDQLAEQDVLTLWGVDEMVWSVTVTKGHGVVKLKDYEAFIGANITVGYESMQQITDDLGITVREGSFNLTVENGDFSATKIVDVIRNEETYVSLDDIGPLAEKMGRIRFEITPFGADLLIDGQPVSYSDAIELTYGEHKVEASLGGYTTYKGTLIVDQAGKTIRIDLPVAGKKEEASAVVTDGTNPDVQNGNDPESPTTEDPTDVNNSEWDSDEYITDAKHSIYVQNPVEASVYLNGEYIGASPIKFKKVIGTHVLTFIKEGYETKSYTVEVPNDGLDTYFSLPDMVEE